VNIRDATAADAAAACDVLRASIAELCVADHRNKADILGRWLANKTPENLASWIADPGASLLLAVEGETILAVGAVRNDGEITMNYVSPPARFRGASSALLEARAKQRGSTSCNLLSTETAHRFYRPRLRGCRRAARQVRHDLVLPDVEGNLTRGSTRRRPTISCGGPAPRI
jgi:GNAT superfamily N-acetyltransferase